MATRHRAFWRYTAFQIPGWILAAGGGWWIYDRLDVPLWIASGVLVAWVIKDFALYPFLRFAYQTDHVLPIERLIGKEAKATGTLDPYGYVHVRGELWRARTASSSSLAQSVAKDDIVEIKGVDGMSLIVTKQTIDGRRFSKEKIEQT